MVKKDKFEKLYRRQVSYHDLIINNLIDIKLGL